MYTLTVRAQFRAAHALRLGGTVEPVHQHRWRVAVAVAGPALDADGVLCDFHVIERELRAVLEPLRERTLNDLPPFCDGVNPSAENVARTIAANLAARLEPRLAGRARVTAVRVTEAPGCAAVYRLPQA